MVANRRIKPWHWYGDLQARHNVRAFLSAKRIIRLQTNPLQSTPVGTYNSFLSFTVNVDYLTEEHLFTTTGTCTLKYDISYAVAKTNQAVDLFYHHSQYSLPDCISHTPLSYALVTGFYLYAVITSSISNGSTKL